VEFCPKYIPFGDPIAGTLVEIYLNQRGIYLTDFSFDLYPALRFFPSVFHSKVEGSKNTFPTMGARVFGWQEPDDLAPFRIGVSCTYLESDGRKLDREGLFDRWFVKGSTIAGGGVWFGTPKPDEPFVIGEGIESTLSAMIILGAGAGVATLAANFLPVVKLPASVLRIVIAADHDGVRSGHIGVRRAIEARARWQREGRTVALEIPRGAGTDFNDILCRRRGILP
jgi:hypothetical protein